MGLKSYQSAMLSLALLELSRETLFPVPSGIGKKARMFYEEGPSINLMGKSETGYVHNGGFVLSEKAKRRRELKKRARN